MVLLIQLEVRSQATEFKYIHKFSVKEGLSSYNVRKIARDEYGYTWAATQYGLNRFDGRFFYQYTNNSAPPFHLSATDIRDLVIDSANHRLWVLTNINGIFIINTTSGKVMENISIPYSDPDDWSHCFTQVAQELWIGNLHGIKIFDIATRKWKKNISHNEVRSLLTDRAGKVWAFIDGYGVEVYDAVSGNSIAKVDVAGQYNCSVQISDTCIVAGTATGLVAIKIRPGYKLDYETRYTAAVYSLSFDGKKLYAGLENTVGWFNTNFSQFTVLQDKSELRTHSEWLSQAKALYDDGNFLWTGTKQGLAYMVKNSFATDIYSSETPAFAALSHVYDIEPVNAQEMLVATNKGLYRVNKISRECVPVKQGLPINNLFPGANNDIIVAGIYGNFVYRNKNLYPLYQLYPELKPYDSTLLVDGVLINDSSLLLAADDGSGALLWNMSKKKVTTMNMATQPLWLGSNTINSLFRARDQKIFILGDKIITIFDPALSKTDSLKLLNPKDGNELGPFFDMTETNDQYWLCSYGNGVVRIDKNYKVLAVYDDKAGLSDNGVYKLFNYNNEQLIVSSNNGLTKITPDPLHFERIYEDEGLHANTFEEATGSIRNNIIYAGGPGGFSVLNPGVFKQPLVKPVLYINRFSIHWPDNTRADTFFNSLTSMRIPSNYSQATVFFSSINYKYPGKISYSYKIAELHDEWISLGLQNFINLVGIAPGSYHLQVKVTDEQGMDSEIREIALVFSPKWFQTIWFRALLVLIVGGAIYLFYRYRMDQLRKRENIRKQISADLHDDIGSTINGIKIFTNLAIMHPGKQEHLLRLKETVQMAIVGVRDMVWVLDDKLDTVNDLISRFEKFAMPIADANNIKIESSVDSNLSMVNLGKEEKRNLYLILKESFNNCVKYAGCTRFTYSISGYGKSKIKLVIKDDGQGFDATSSSNGNGLKNMRSRAEQIRFNFLIQSEPGAGTIIVVFRQS